MYCKKCGAYLPDKAIYCSSCGMRVVHDAEPIPIQSGKPARHGKYTIVIGAIAVVAMVLAACAIGLAVYNRQSDQLAVAQRSQQVGQSNGVGGGTMQRTDTQSSAQPTETTSTTTTSGTTESTTTSTYTTTTTTTTTATTTTKAAGSGAYYYYGDAAASDNEYYTRASKSGYLWPTDSQYISASDLKGLSQDSVAAIRNEIYARHGYSFNTARWKNYFSGKTWYKLDDTCTDATIRARLSSTERANISAIVAYEESRGWR